ncbi:hypothetical protein [Clostridium sp.]|jgi:hypothetical protein|uniref:hypothetical protein n=1 Tax=Clostridium sp. TaxID=1506 RepID=UPI003EEB382E
MANDRKQCPNCANKTSGDTIYKYNKCGKLFCIKCGECNFIRKTNCPKCKTTNTNFHCSINSLWGK